VGCSYHLQRPVGSAPVVHELCTLPSRCWVAQLCFSVFRSFPSLPPQAPSLPRGVVTSKSLSLLVFFCIDPSAWQPLAPVCLIFSSTRSSHKFLLHHRWLPWPPTAATISDVVRYRFHPCRRRAASANLFCTPSPVLYSSTAQNSLCPPCFHFTWKSCSFKLTEALTRSGTYE